MCRLVIGGDVMSGVRAGGSLVAVTDEPFLRRSREPGDRRGGPLGAKAVACGRVHATHQGVDLAKSPPGRRSPREGDGGPGDPLAEDPIAVAQAHGDRQRGAPRVVGGRRRRHHQVERPHPGDGVGADRCPPSRRCCTGSSWRPSQATVTVDAEAVEVVAPVVDDVELERQPLTDAHRRAGARRAPR